MFRSGLVRSVFFGYCALVLLTAGGLGVFLSERLADEEVAHLRAGLHEQAELLARLAEPSLSSAPDPALQDRVREIGRVIGTRFTVIRDDGTVVADSESDPAAMENHRSRPEVLDARARGEGVTFRLSQTTRRQMMYLAIPVRSAEGAAVGFARAAYPLTHVESKARAVRRNVLAGAAAIAILLAGTAGVLVRRQFGPFIRLVRDVENLGAGRAEGPLDDRRADEIGRMAAAVNAIRQSGRDGVEAHRRDRSKLLAILGSMVEGVVAVDLDERVVHMNGVAGKLLGADPERSTGRHIWEVTRSREVPMILGQTLRGETEVTTEAAAIGPARDRLVELYASPLRDGADRVTGAVVVLHDITELRRLEEIRRNFFANASHEFKTPITAIHGLVETLIEDDAMPADTRRRFLERIRDQSNRMSALVGDMLALSRLESIGEEPEREIVDLRAVAAESAQVLAAAARAKSVRLTVARPDDPVPVLGHRLDLSAMAENLIDNAVKYTPEGGGVEVTVGVDGVFAVLEVRDDGIGIAQQHHTRIFERFYRVDHARSRELGGTGLGLAIVKHIVLSHGGGITVRSAPGAGSTFLVRLPLAAAWNPPGFAGS